MEDLDGTPYAKAVNNSDGTLQNTTLHIKGESFFCSCGCNVFHQPDSTKPGSYQCNSCVAVYTIT